METVLRQFATTPLILLLLAILFVYVMTRNYLRFRGQRVVPDLIEGEELVDEFEVLGSFVTTRTLLTNRRVIQLRLDWWLSKRRQFALAIADLHCIVFSRRAFAWAFLLAIALVGFLNPLALVVFLWALESKIYSVLFDTPFHLKLSLTTDMAARGSRREQLAEFERFYRKAHSLWAKVRTERSLAAPSVTPSVTEETDFAWGQPVWVYVWGFLVLATLQRLVEPHVSLQAFFFGALYLGIPVAVARRSRRDALWAALIGPVALLTVKYPHSGFASLVTSDGGAPRFGEYILLLVVFALMTFTAWAISEVLHPSVAPLAIVLWLIFPLAASPQAFLDLSLYSNVLAGVAAASALAWVEHMAGRHYGTA